MNEEFVNDLIICLEPLVETDKLLEVKNKICSILQYYNIEKITNEIVPFGQQFPACYEYYMVTKHIEGISDKTLANYKIFLEDMLSKLTKPLNEVTPNDIRAYLYTLQQERGISNISLENRRACLSSFFGWVASEGYIDKNPMLTVKPIKCEEKEREPLTSIEMERVREACKTKRDKAMIEVLYSTACRVTEFERLNKSDINTNTLEVKLFGKGNKHRTSYLTSRALLYLQEYLDERKDDNEALFVGLRAPYNRLKKSAIEKCVREIGERAGIHLYPHLIRHTAATAALNHGMDVTSLQKILGHSQTDTTMIYAKINQENVKNSHEKFF